MGNCMVTRRRRSLFQKKKDKPATKAVPAGQSLRSTSSSNRSVSSKLETITTTRSSDHNIVLGKKLEISEKITSNDDHDAKSTGAARVMRIRVVVTQSQLRQILKESKNSASSAAVKQMLLTSAIKVSSTEKNSLSSSARNDQPAGSTNGRWRPRLKSISEEE